MFDLLYESPHNGTHKARKVAETTINGTATGIAIVHFPAAEELVSYSLKTGNCRDHVGIVRPVQTEGE